MTQFTVIIPARYASSRLPGKPLADIVGKPMIQHVFEQAKQSGATRVIIAPTMTWWLPPPKTLVQKCA